MHQPSFFSSHLISSHVFPYINHPYYDRITVSYAFPSLISFFLPSFFYFSFPLISFKHKYLAANNTMMKTRQTPIFQTNSHSHNNNNTDELTAALISKPNNSNSRTASMAMSMMSTIHYGECQRNHAASIGGYAVDGCREFMASGEEGTTGALFCAACGCHRNFHQRQVELAEIDDDEVVCSSAPTNYSINSTAHDDDDVY